MEVPVNEHGEHHLERERAGALIGEIRRDEPDRKQIARRPAARPDRERIWGQDAGARASA